MSSNTEYIIVEDSNSLPTSFIAAEYHTKQPAQHHLLRNEDRSTIVNYQHFLKSQGDIRPPAFVETYFCKSL